MDGLTKTQMAGRVSALEEELRFVTGRAENAEGDVKEELTERVRLIEQQIRRYGKGKTRQQRAERRS